ncbi:hypothetical protein MRB53_027587 [Persea americana]|uniref:Uncharacterized protein n=1 Tax=Persea americana TaxID=3435 RepID=A0ACC2LMI8_PERAE|nr:hypothetical protein MRB53_027587 [Persea americana]
MPSDGDLFPPKIPATKWFNVYCETPKRPSSFPLLLLPLIHSRRQLEASPSPLRQPCPRSWKIISSNEVVKSIREEMMGSYWEMLQTEKNDGFVMKR